MRRALAVGLCCVLVLVIGATPASAHGQHLSADAQYADNGTVVIESLFTATGGFLVLHADDGGEPGEPIGHSPTEYGYETGLTVNVSDETWQAWNGSRTVWAVLHLDDGDGEFDPADDEPVPAFGGSAKQSFAVDKRAAGPASVVASGFGSQPTSGSVTIERVALGHEGWVVVRTDRDGEPGAVVGRTALAAGVHENVSVTLDQSSYRNQDSRFGLWATVAERGSPVMIDGAPVASDFTVRKAANTTGADATTTATATSTRSTAGTSEASATEGSGFGFVVGILAIAGTAALALVRRRRR
ncbi:MULTISPECIES: DUF7282 domain-containing protein [Halococcus]|uniref:DUF7282 domain-containing protein n=1 Tax=Halococcus salifodinae DSM 8989 TaxID=1227456 RepID=M0N5X7_9EURY|nr:MULTISPECIES: hypothetical protein [Halococcus]EMA52499.1 hypothetical protein C450_10388 [Halococcus salifodinae DSM 8989]